MKKLFTAALAAVALLATSCGEVVGPDRAQPNHAPVVSVSGPSSAEPGETITLAAVASDADGDVLTFTWTSSEAGDVIASPTTAVTAVVLGAVESTRTFWVRVDDDDTTATASLAVTVERDSVPPPTPDCTRRAAAFSAADDPSYVVANHPYVSFYDSYGVETLPQVTVAGAPLGVDWWQFDLSAYAMYARFNWHQRPVDWSLSREERDAQGCWAVVETTTLNGDEVFRKRTDPDGWSFEWTPTSPPCAMLPLGSSDWRDDATTVTVVADHPLWSLFDAYGRESEPAVTVVGAPAGAGWWSFKVSVEDLERLVRSNFHQSPVDWSLSRDERAAMGCWADLLRTSLPADAPFAVRSDPDGLSLEHVGPSDVPDPVAGFLYLDLRGYYLANFQYWSFYGAGPLETLASTSVIEGLFAFEIAAVDVAAANNPQSNLHTESRYDSPTNVWAGLQGPDVWVAPRTRFSVVVDHLERTTD